MIAKIEKENFALSKAHILEMKNTFEVGIKLKQIVKFITSLQNDKDIKQKILKDTELVLENNKSDLVTVTTTKSTFDYTQCGHKEYDSLLQIQKSVNARIKEIETNDLKPLLIKKNAVNIFEKGEKNDLSNEKTIIVEFDHEYSVYTNGSEVNVIKAPENIKEMGLKYTV